MEFLRVQHSHRSRNSRTKASRTRSVAKSGPIDRRSVSERIICSASSADAAFFKTASRAAATCSISFKTSSSRSSKRSIRARAIRGQGSPSGWRREVSCSRRSRRKALKPFTPSVARMPSILLAIDRRSQVKSSRSRYARRASSSASLGIGTIEQTRGSPRSQAINVRSSISTSMISVFARRARRSTGRLDGCIT